MLSAIFSRWVDGSFIFFWYVCFLLFFNALDLLLKKGGEKGDRIRKRGQAMDYWNCDSRRHRGGIVFF